MVSKVFVFLFFSATVLAAHAHSPSSTFNHEKFLATQTKEALQTLKSLSPICSREAENFILTEKENVHTNLLNCSRSAIAFHTAELMTDSAYFSFSLWNQGSVILENVKTCFTKKCFLEKVVCAVERLPQSAVAATEVGFGAIAFALELKNLIPEIVEEIKECKSKKIDEYSRYLESHVKKAKMC